MSPFVAVRKSYIVIKGVLENWSAAKKGDTMFSNFCHMFVANWSSSV